MQIVANDLFSVEFNLFTLNSFYKGQNSVFALRLEDVSGVFDVEPKFVTGSSPVSIRIANGTLDYENPNQRKFIVLVSISISAHKL